MDPVSLTLGGVVAGLVAKAVDAGSDRLVSGAGGALGRLVDRLRARFSEHGDTEASRALQRVEVAPDSPSRLEALAAVVDRYASNEGRRTELEALVAEAGYEGVDVNAVVQSAWGSQNVQIGGVTASELSVTYGLRRDGYGPA